jgi:hypothetical protein
VTTIDTAAARGRKTPATLALASAILALGLAGCGSTLGGLLGSSSEPNAALTETGTTPAPAPGARGRLAVASVLGPPETIAKPLQTQLTAALEKQNVGLVKSPAEKADYTVKGYVTSGKDKASTKVTYLWEVRDAADNRVNQITGEELVAGAPGKDPWSNVTPQVLQSIADKTAGSIVSWLPGTATQGPGIAAAQPAKTAAAGPAAGLPATPAGSGPVTALVGDISGAPGDGSTALKVALRRELSRGGLSLTEAQTAGVYRVEGKVHVGEGKDGKQPIQIDWSIKDAAGQSVGNVSQKNEIAQGTLDGAWGKTADLAAAAAAQGILKLLPPAKSIN